VPVRWVASLAAVTVLVVNAAMVTSAGAHVHGRRVPSDMRQGHMVAAGDEHPPGEACWTGILPGEAYAGEWVGVTATNGETGQPVDGFFPYFFPPGWGPDDYPLDFSGNYSTTLGTAALCVDYGSYDVYFSGCNEERVDCPAPEFIPQWYPDQREATSAEQQTIAPNVVPDISVTLWPLAGVTVSVSCGAMTSPGRPSECTGTVSDTNSVQAAGPPTGSLGFTFDPSGLSGSSCKLATSDGSAASCSISVPAGGGSETVTASYPGDVAHHPGTGTTSFTVPTVDSGSGDSGDMSCTPFVSPDDWNTYPVGEPTPGVEPLNVIISACSSVSLSEILNAMTEWGAVRTGVPCLSAERADVAGHWRDQDESWRLGRCVGGGIALARNGTENHARLWSQPVSGGDNPAWFISSSYETLCVKRKGVMVSVVKHIGYAAHHRDWWHCIDGSQGSFGRDGYDRGAEAFVSALETAGALDGWHVEVTTVARPSGVGEGHDHSGPTFSGRAYLVTIKS
jgi:hypothetical protein